MNRYGTIVEKPLLLNHCYCKCTFAIPSHENTNVTIKMQCMCAFAYSPEAKSCVDRMQLLIFPKPGCYFTITYNNKQARRSLSKTKNMACQHNKAFISLSLHPLPHKNGPKEPLGIAIAFFSSTRSSVHAAERLRSVCHVGSSKNKSFS